MWLVERREVMKVLSREVVWKRPCTGETRAEQAVRKAEERLSG